MRDRDREFTDAAHPSADELLTRFRDAVAMVARTIRAQGDLDLIAPVESQVPIRSRLGLFLVCASHLNNHIGQMSYLVQALRPGTGPDPTW